MVAEYHYHSKKSNKIKKSFGIICCRQLENIGLQIVMIKKPVTYYFCEFVAGHYHKNNEKHLQILFNNMSYHEKIDILSLKFANMWYRIYKTNPEHTFIQPNPAVGTKNYMLQKAK